MRLLIANKCQNHNKYLCIAKNLNLKSLFTSTLTIFITVNKKLFMLNKQDLVSPYLYKGINEFCLQSTVLRGDSKETL
jgi:hypothetical protein